MKNLTFVPYALAIVSVTLTAISQLLLKASALAAARSEPAGAQDLFLTLLSTPSVWLGVAAMGLSLILWLLVLTRIDVSVAYPFTALGMALTVAGGHWFFGEAFSVGRAVGITLIMTGVLILAWF